MQEINFRRLFFLLEKPTKPKKKRRGILLPFFLGFILGMIVGYLL